MENIKFSKAALSAGLAKIIGSNGGVYLNIGGEYDNTFIRIYKGTQLTSAQFNSATTATSVENMVSAVGGALLITNYTINAAGSVSNNTARIVDSNYNIAQAGGIATWFYVFSLSSSGLNNSFTINNSFMGTISDASGTGDLRLTSTNIIQGNQYRVNALNLSIPFEFTF